MFNPWRGPLGPLVTTYLSESDIAAEIRHERPKFLAMKVMEDVIKSP